jgi:hypothetical protein
LFWRTITLIINYTNNCSLWFVLTNYYTHNQPHQQCGSTYLFCSSIVINTVIVTDGNFEP